MSEIITLGDLFKVFPTHDELEKAWKEKDDRLVEFNDESIKKLKDYYNNLKKDAKVGIPISWVDLTRVQIKDKVYCVQSDGTEVYVTVNGEEVPDSRQPDRNINYIIAFLMDVILGDLKVRRGRTQWVRDLKRKYKPDVLIEIANHLEDLTNGYQLAMRIDNLRSRLDQLEVPALLVQPAVLTEQESPGAVKPEELVEVEEPVLDEEEEQVESEV